MDTPQIHVQTKSVAVANSSPNTILQKDLATRRKERRELIKRGRELGATLSKGRQGDIFVKNTHPRLDPRRHAVLFENFLAAGPDTSLSQDTGQEVIEKRENIDNNMINPTEKLDKTAEKGKKSSIGCGNEDGSFDPFVLKPLDLPLDLGDGIGFDPKDFGTCLVSEGDTMTKSSSN